MAKRNPLKDKVLGKHRPNAWRSRDQWPDKIALHRELYRIRTYERSPQRQSKGTLRAKYGEQDKVWRIAYVANGFWQLQKFNREVDKSKDADRWQPRARPTSFENAIAQLQRKDRELEHNAA